MQQGAVVNERARGRSFSSMLATYGPTYGAAAALVLLILFNLIYTNNFATRDNLFNTLLQVSPTILVAIGMTLVIATGGIDLSVGSVMAIASALAAITLGNGLLIAILLALAVSFGVGALNGALISGFRIQPIIVTLAALITGRGLAQVLSEGGQLIVVTDPRFMYLGRGYIGPVPVQVLIMVLIACAAIFVMRSTSFGRYVVAVGGNEAAARLAGIKTNWTKIAVYATSGLLAGIAGLIETARLGASDAAKVGQNIELDAIAAVVVGGTPLTGGRATVVGTIIGALIMQVISMSFIMNDIKFSWSLVLKAAIILIAVYIQRPKIA